jgi:hypothetical protein
VLSAQLDLIASRGWTGKLAGHGNRQPLVSISGPDAAFLQETASLLASERLRSAALVSSPLAPDELFIAAEWWNRLVVDKRELPSVEALSEWLVPEGEFAPRNLVIYGTPPVRAACWSPGLSAMLRS